MLCAYRHKRFFLTRGDILNVAITCGQIFSVIRAWYAMPGFESGSMGWEAGMGLCALQPPPASYFIVVGKPINKLKSLIGKKKFSWSIFPLHLVRLIRTDTDADPDTDIDADVDNQSRYPKQNWCDIGLSNRLPSRLPFPGLGESHK